MKSMRYVILGAVLVGAMALYGWWWSGKSDEVEAAYEAAFAEILPLGTNVTYTITDSGGFPFRIYHTFSDVTVTLPTRSTIRIETLDVIQQPWSDDHMMFKAHGRMTRQDVDGTILWALEADKNIASLVGYQSDQLNFDMDARSVTLFDKDGGIYPVPMMQVHLRQMINSDTPSTEVAFSVRSAGMVPEDQEADMPDFSAQGLAGLIQRWGVEDEQTGGLDFSMQVGPEGTLINGEKRPSQQAGIIQSLF